MKVLSIRQPWASLIVEGFKDIENRTWMPKFRGVFQVHAAKLKDFKAMKTYQHLFPPDYVFNYGGVIGEVELVDVVRDHSSEWFDGPYGFILKNPKPIPFEPMKGQLMFFEKKS